MPVHRPDPNRDVARRRRRPRWALLGLLALSGTAGCRALGPGTVVRDQLAYHRALTRTQKEQLLLNIVQLRYLDPPVMLEIGQLVAGYTFESELQLSGDLLFGGDDSAGVGGRGLVVERPTITYTPVRGARLVELLLTPITPESILFLIESGWPADLILALTVESLNGVHNPSSIPLNRAEGDVEFLEVTQLLAELQAQDRLALRVLQAGDGTATPLLTLRRDGEHDGSVDRLCELLDLDPEAEEFNLRYGTRSSDRRSVDLLARSVLQILYELSASVSVPAAHEEAGWALPAEPVRSVAPRLKVESSRSEPDAAFSKVLYRGHWYWIGDADLDSKRVFSFLLLILNFVQAPAAGSLPVVTIPAG